MDLSFTPLLDGSVPLVKDYMEFTEELQLGSRMIYLLEGPEADLPAAIEELTQLLESNDEVDSVLSQVPLEWLEQQGPWIVDREHFDTWMDVATKPASVEELREAQKLAEGLEEKYSDRVAKVEGARILYVILSTDALQQPMGKSSYGTVEKIVQEALSDSAVVANPSGVPSIAEQDQVQTLGSIQRLTPASLLLVLLILRRVEPRIIYLLSVALPMVLAMGATLGLSGRITGSITILETLFGVMIFGLGVDFALHLMSRQREGLQRGLSFEEALAATLNGTGVGVLVGALTTIGAFTILALSPSVEAFHLGTSGAIGLMICLVLMLTLLPAIWAILDRRGFGEELLDLPPLRFSIVSVLTGWATSRPKQALLVGLVMMVTSGSFLPTLTMETDLAKTFNRDVPAIKVSERIQELYRMNFNPWVFQAENVDEMVRIHNAAEQLPFVDRVDSLAQLYPNDRIERQVLLQENAPKVQQMQNHYLSMMSMIALQGGPNIGPLIQSINHLLQAVDGPPKIDALPPFLSKQFRSKEGSLLVYVYGQEGTLDGKLLHDERIALEKISPNVAGIGSAVEGVMYIERPWLWRSFAFVFAYVIVMLLADTRNWKWFVLTATPVVFGSIVTFGIMCMAGFHFSVLTLIALPLIFGLGVDNGIHVIHRIRESEESTAYEATVSVGQPIVLTTLTTCASFGVLIFTNHPGMESLSTVLLIGLPVCLYASLTLIPAGTVLLGLRER